MNVLLLAATAILAMPPGAADPPPRTGSAPEPGTGWLEPLAAPPVVPLADPAWLVYLNGLRGLAGLPAVTENPTWSAGDVLHSQYCVKTDTIGHSEDPTSPWFTPEGNAAAASGNVMVSSSVAASDSYALDLWMTGPFHGVGMIDPQLVQVGFGSYREAIGTWKMAATLDVLRGLASLPPGVTFPVPWPGNGSYLELTSYGGSEWPDPLTSCSGFTAPTGLPVILQLGSGSLTPVVTAHSFSDAGVPLEHCIFDETSYSNPDAYSQSLGRSVLGSRDAVVLIPRQPLVFGHTYTASITASGTTTAWSFTIGTPPPSRSGDANGDGRVDVADIFRLIDYLYAGGPTPEGDGDVDGDGRIDTADVLVLAERLFR